MTPPFVSLCLGFILLASTASAKGSNHDQSAKGIYSPSDRNAAMKSRVESPMGIYPVHPPRRHESERVQYRKSRLTISIWHPVGETSDLGLKTRAVKWLLFGRTQYAKGARGIFGEFPQVKRITLTFHDVIRSSRKSRRRRGVRERIKKYVSISLDRKAFERLDIDAAKECVDRMDCRVFFRSNFSRRLFNRRYIQRTRQEL